MIKRLDRIVTLLEEQNVLLSKRTTARPAKLRTENTGDCTKQLVATYCDAYKERHGSYPIIDGKAAGVARNLLRTLPLERAQDIVRAYLQMDTSWFKTRGWALDTLAQNLNSVALSLANGTKEPGEKAYWEKVFGGGDSEQGRISDTDRTTQSDIRRGETLPSGASSATLACVSDGGLFSIS